MNSPLEFAFTTEAGMSEREIQQLWHDTQKAQKAMDNFLMGNLSEFDLTDILDICGVDSEETAIRLELNLQQLGIL